MSHWTGMNRLKPCRLGKFGSERSAQAYAKYMRNNLGKDLVVYECHKCFYWHVERRGKNDKLD